MKPIRLMAYRCAGTYRATDYSGGCNGARIRFQPESEWATNAGAADALKTPVAMKIEFKDVSYSDLIVLAGVTALEKQNDSLDLAFCGGRVDVEGPPGSNDVKDLSPRIYSDPLITVLDDFLVKGLTKEEGVALAGRHNVGSQYYKDLLANNGNFDKYEMALLQNSELKAAVENFAANEGDFKNVFQVAWTKMMTADRFDGPTTNACTGVSTITKEEKNPRLSDGHLAAAIVVPIIFLALMVALYLVLKNQCKGNATDGKAGH
jgi:catalase-peroxidase